jgi:hypothetical protein
MPENEREDHASPRAALCSSNKMRYLVVHGGYWRGVCSLFRRVLEIPHSSV